MRKAAFILNIIDAVVLGIGAFVTFILAISLSVVGGAAAGQSPNPEEAEMAMTLAQTVYWIAFVILLIGLAIQIFAAVLNKRAVSKSSVTAPAILSIIFGGILGLIAGILLLVADNSEYETVL